MSEIEAIALKQTGKSLSIVKESLLAIKARVDVFLIAMLLFGALSGIFYQLSPIKDYSIPTFEMCSEQADVEACQQAHQAEILNETMELGQEIIDNAVPLILLFTGGVLAAAVAFYFMSVFYLRKELASVPNYSVSGFRYWVSKLSWKYTRPMLWLFLPVIGWVMYYRSMLRYELVGYLALMGHDEPLNASWDITENNVWRIFGSQIVLGLLYGFIIVVCFFAGIAVLGGDFLEKGLSGVLLNGVMMGGSYMLTIFISFATFSVLTEEWKTKEVEEK